MTLCECGREIVQPHVGGRRSRCDVCSPRRPQPKRRAPVLELPIRAEIAAKQPEKAQKRPRRTLTECTSADLEAVGRLDTSQGVAALQLAELVDAGGYTAQGAAALIKAHREAMDVALEGAGAKADVIDLIFGAEA